VEEAGPGAGCGGARLGLTTQLTVHGWSSDLGLRQLGRGGEARFGGRRERARRRLGSMQRKEGGTTARVTGDPGTGMFYIL
jgi:hypothetical protein